MKLAGTYFDGQSSRRHPVAVEVVDRELVLSGGAIERRYRVANLEVGECLDQGPMSLQMDDGSSCEVADGLALESMIERAGRRRPLTVVLQRHAVWAVASLVLLVALAISGYRWGLPWTAEKLAPQIPAAAVDKLGKLVLRSLDRQLLRPSTLSQERQAAVRASVATLATTQALPEHQLLFRASTQLGANAFALPGGTVVVLDRLAAQASDEQVLAVIAHELGHLAHHHPMRRLIQDAVVSTAVAAYVGDLSTAVASATALALNASYSRVFELQADRYAAERLIAAGKDPLALVSLLEKIDHPDRTSNALASHPDLAERAAAIRRLLATREVNDTPPAKGTP